MTKKLYQWDIVGLGGTAHEFASTFKQETSQLAAVASRTLSKVEQFAADCSIPKAYGSYEELLADETINVVYIVVSNKRHAEHILKALQAGKHVLCEKAITMNAAELKQTLAAAEKNDLILAEAMTIFNMPLYDELRHLIDAGKFSRLKMVQAPSGSYKEPDPKNCFFSPDLAGGALLDIGTYAVPFARWFFSSQPDVLASSMAPFSTGVDEQSMTLLRNKENELAIISLTFQAKVPKRGIVAFEDAYITITGYLHADETIVYYNDGTVKTIASGYSAETMNYETYNMVEAIKGTQSNRSLFPTTEVIDILDQM